MDKELKPHISSLFSQTYGHNVGIKIYLGLREVIILDIQSTMDLFCDQDLV